MKRFRRIQSYLDWLKPYRDTIILLVCLGAVGTILELVQPICVRYIVDKILIMRRVPLEDRIHDLDAIGGLFTLIIISYSVNRSIADYRQDALAAGAALKLRRAIVARLLDAPLPKLWEIKVGGILSRLTSDVDATAQLVGVCVTTILLSAMRLVCGITVLSVLNWRIAVVSSTLFLPALILSMLLVKQVRPIYQSVCVDEEVANGHIAEVFYGIRVVRAYCQERLEALKQLRERNAIARKRLQAKRREGMILAVWGILIGLMNVGVVWYGGYLVIRGEASVGDIVMFQWYVLLLLTPIWTIVSSISNVQRAFASMERVFEVLAYEKDKPDCPGAQEAPANVDELSFENVEFCYREGSPVIRRLNLKVYKGMVIALVGPSGAGKTTLIDLTTRFHDPTSGRILLNGLDLRSLKLSSYRKLTAMVHQQILLFDGSIRDNIAYSKNDATTSEVERAAKLANAHEFIVKLPNGYNTSVGERGVKLSGGEQQRLAIARALMKSPQVLILDEATSNLDIENERMIQSALSTLFEGRISFVIAHRLSTVCRADLILVMRDGVVVERGDHNGLLEARGTYYEMVTKQSVLEPIS